MPVALFECPEIGIIVVDQLVEIIKSGVWRKYCAVAASDWCVWFDKTDARDHGTGHGIGVKSTIWEDSNSALGEEESGKDQSPESGHDEGGWGNMLNGPRGISRDGAMCRAGFSGRQSTGEEQ